MTSSATGIVCTGLPITEMERQAGRAKPKKEKLFETFLMNEKSNRNDTAHHEIYRSYDVSVYWSKGLKQVSIPETHRGQYDVELYSPNKEIKFEVKVATQDVHGSFQFNGVRYDRDFTHLFCLGIMPNDVRFTIVPRADFHKYTLVSMAQGSNATFKLTRRETDLLTFSQFERIVNEFLK